jgi:hypothetical protein
MWKRSDELIYIRCMSDYLNSKSIQENFPDLGRGGDNGVSILTLAKKIKESNKIPAFSDYTPQTIGKFVRIAFKGGLFENNIIYGLLSKNSETLNLERCMKPGNLSSLVEFNGYDLWSDDETEYLVKHYNNGKTPKRIYVNYNLQENFSDRTYDAISLKFDELRKNEIIGRQRIDWSGDVGLYAELLFGVYGKDDRFISKNAKSLDEYFYPGEGKITNGKLSNFYKRINIL